VKKKFLIVLIVIVLLLDWAALHDITAGREPQSALGGEYITLIFSVLALIVIGYLIYRNKQSRN